MNVPPILRAQSQLNSAVRAPPMWRYPVGDGANRTRGFDEDMVRGTYVSPGRTVKAVAREARAAGGVESVPDSPNCRCARAAVAVSRIARAGVAPAGDRCAPRRPLRVKRP